MSHKRHFASNYFLSENDTKHIRAHYSKSHYCFSTGNQRKRIIYIQSLAVRTALKLFQNVRAVLCDSQKSMSDCDECAHIYAHVCMGRHRLCHFKLCAIAVCTFALHVNVCMRARACVCVSIIVGCFRCGSNKILVENICTRMSCIGDGSAPSTR